MRNDQVVGMGLLAFSLVFSGCARVKTQLVEKPRVDQEIQGNRGYLAGSAPPSAERKTTRTMVQTDIELKTMEEMNPWKKQAAETPPAASVPAPVMIQPQTQTWQPPAQEEWEEEAAPVQEAPVREAAAGTSYVVQKGDTLQKIAEKFYGSNRKWKRIYDANQDVLKSPDRVYPGQELTIPSGARAEAENEDGSQYK